MSDPTRAPVPADPLVPLLPIDSAGVGADPVALATWYMALASAVAVEVPNDLFALWLYPATGGVVLLGPDALSNDHVPVPIPAPVLSQEQLFGLEQVFRSAKYQSAIAVPVRSGNRDVAVMSLGRFAPGAFGAAQALRLRRLAGYLSSDLSELAAVLSAVAPHPTVEPEMSREALPEHLARVACEAASGPDLVRRVSGILHPLIPHDRLEILVTGTSPGRLWTLSGHSQRRRWSGGARVDPFSAVVSMFNGGRTTVLEDLTELEGAGEWTVGGGSTPSLPARSLLGASLQVGGRTVGYLLLASVGRDAYRPEDEETMALAALLLAPRVAALAREGDRTATEGPPGADGDGSGSSSEALAAAAAALAGTGHLREALAGFDRELAKLVPHSGWNILLKSGEQQVVTLDPLAPRPLADLPPAPLGGETVSALLFEDQEWLVRTVREEEELMVPLRVAGRITGAVSLRSAGFSSAAEAAEVVRRFADVLAPHLELLRRGAASGAGSPSRNTGALRG